MNPLPLIASVLLCGCGGPRMRAISPGQTVTMAWDNFPQADEDKLVTGLEASQDLVNWVEVYRQDYSYGEIQATIYGRPVDHEFYRAFNGYK